jgi:uncharacterized protein
MRASLLSIFKTALIGYLGGQVFYLAALPLPWVIGSLASIIIWNGITRKKLEWPLALKNGGSIILGIHFGLYFTIGTFQTIGPYLTPFLVANFILIFLSFLISSMITKWVNIDQITSVFGSMPGGLPEMVLASENLHAKSSFVLVFQTIRLITVVFIVPSVVIYFFKEQNVLPNNMAVMGNFVLGGWSYIWFIIPAIFGVLFRKKIPAGILIVPLVMTAVMNISPISLTNVPPIILIFGQIAVGIGLGQNISFSALKSVGKYCGVYFGVTLLLIAISFGLGVLLALATGLNLETSILCLIPGGFIEMVLTAGAVGADPSIVSALQLTRLLVMLMIVLPLLKWYFKKRITLTLLNKGQHITK